MLWHLIIVCGLYQYYTNLKGNGVIYISRTKQTKITDELTLEKTRINIKKLYNRIYNSSKLVKEAIHQLSFPEAPSLVGMRIAFLILARKGYEPERTLVEHAITKGYIELDLLKKKLKEIYKDECKILEKKIEDLKREPRLE